MAFRLIPRDEAFYPLFDESAQLAADAAAQLRQLLGRLPIAEADVQPITDGERRGDQIGRDVRQRLQTSIVTPFDREDIQTLSGALDDVLDEIRAAADMAYLHKVSTELPGLDELALRLVEITSLNVELVKRLRNLREVSAVHDQIDAKESEADQTYRRITAELYSGRHEALDILRWTEVVAAIEGAIDAVETASDEVMSIAVKHA